MTGFRDDEGRADTGRPGFLGHGRAEEKKVKQKKAREQAHTGMVTRARSSDPKQLHLTTLACFLQSKKYNLSQETLLDIQATQSATLAAASTSSAPAPRTATASFADTLAASQTTRKADFVSGRLGIDLDSRGQPAKVIYFDEAGQKLSSSTFSAQQILKKTAEYGIDLNDLTSLGEQLDTAGIGYRPYELYKGTGSDHGIDFADLIAGGLGTAYDWRKDANAALKGPTATQQVAAAQALSDSLSLTRHTEVTQNRGIDPAYFAPLGADNESPRTQVMFNGQVASWYRTAEEAASAAVAYQGSVTDLAATQTSTTVADTAFSAATSTTANAAVSASTSAIASTEAAPADDAATQLQSLLQSTGSLNSQSVLDKLIASLSALRQSG